VVNENITLKHNPVQPDNFRSTRAASPREILADNLNIAGQSKVSTVDWPGKLVTTLFLQGCPWRCTFCHNWEILDPRVKGEITWDSVRKLLAKRKGLLDGIVFSGGEPTMQHELVPAVKEAKEMGFLVGLHSGGAYPERLREIMPYLDWVGFDVKSPWEMYEAVTGVKNSSAKALESLRLILDAGVDVQVRTTVDPTVMDVDDVHRLTAELEKMGVKEHHLQTVRTVGAKPEYVQQLHEAGGSIDVSTILQGIETA
jgi:pyruvate formate lyase activating enzyme